MIFTILISFILFLAFLLVVAVLAQNPKGGGLSSSFGGAAASNIIGVKKTSEFLEKLTWGFIFGIIVLCMASTYVGPSSASSTKGGILDRVDELPQQSAQPLPIDPNAPTDTTK